MCVNQDPIGGPEGPEEQGIIQVFRHEGEGEEQIRGQGQGKQGQHDMGILLQDAFGKEITGDQGRRDQEGIEGGDETGAKQAVTYRIEGRKKQGIKELCEADRGGIDVQGAAEPDVLGKLQVKEFIVIGNSGLRIEGKKKTDRCGDQQEKGKEELYGRSFEFGHFKKSFPT